MDERSNDGAEPARRSDYPVQGAPTQPVQTPPTGYIPPEVRPTGTGTTATGPEVARVPTENGATYGNGSPDSAPYTYSQVSVPPAQPAQPTQPLPAQQPVYAQPAVRERARHGSPIAGPVILIGAGVLFLLNTLEIVSWDVWDQLWRLWPLILIAIGLDLLLGRRNPWLSLVIVVAVLAAGAAVVLSSGGFQTRGEIANSNLNIPVSGARDADIEIDFGAGTLYVDGTAGGENLATGDLEYYSNRGQPTQSVNRSGDSVSVNLRQPQSTSFFNFGFGPNRGTDWNIHLNPNVPMTVKADLGAGNSTLDFSQIKATDIDVDNGAGNTEVVFPAAAGAVSGKVSGGVGNLNIKIPEGAAARIKVDTGLGNISADSRFTKRDDTYETADYNSATNKIDLELDMGVGNVEISR
jgi:hypothetical protein